MIPHPENFHDFFFYRPDETSYRIGGFSPGDLPLPSGDYYLNGPSLFVRDKALCRHAFDGDGMIRKLSFTKEGVTFSRKFVRTRKFMEETRHEKFLFSTFGSAHGGPFACPANLSVFRGEGELWAYGDGGLPWRIDPQTLETLGEADLPGLGLKDPLAAHPKRDPLTGEWLNFSVYGFQLHLYRFSPRLKLLQKTLFTLPSSLYIHDFLLAPPLAVFHLGPHRLNIHDLLFMKKTPLESLRWDQGTPSELLVLNSESGRLVSRVLVPGEGRHGLHPIHLQRTGEKSLCLDLIEDKNPFIDQYLLGRDHFARIRNNRVVRMEIDISHERGKILSRMEYPLDFHMEFPKVLPQSEGTFHQGFWFLGVTNTSQAGSKYYNTIGYFDWNKGSVSDSYTTEPGFFLGAGPEFLQEGYLLCQMLDLKGFSSSFLLFNSRCLHRGPVLRLPLQTPDHFGYHGCFCPSQGEQTQ